MAENRGHLPNDHRVSSWSELQESLFADSWNPQLRRFRSSYAFRGLASVTEFRGTATGFEQIISKRPGSN